MRILTLREFEAVVGGETPKGVRLDQRVIAYGRQLNALYDLHQACRRFNETVFGYRSEHGVACEIDVGRRVPNDWDRALIESWPQRKARLAAERVLQGLVAAGLARGAPADRREVRV